MGEDEPQTGFVYGAKEQESRPQMVVSLLLLSSLSLPSSLLIVIVSYKRLSC